jgi:peptidoglycan glycosyltransferase
VTAPLRKLAVVVAAMFALLLASSTWIQALGAQGLNERPGNVRTLYKEFGRQRGPLLVSGKPVAESIPVDDPYKYQRVYKPGELYSAVTGFYSVVYGASGMEEAVNDLLSGTSDQLFYRRFVDLLTDKQSRGASVEMTIDPKAQKAAWDALGSQAGAVVALDPRTGAILALVSKPGYDPNKLAGHKTREVTKNRKELLEDPARPMENRAIAGRLYPPGSVFKVVTAATALESGDYTPQSQLKSPNVFKLPQSSSTLRNFGGESCGGSSITMTEALRISCNTAFAWLGVQLGDDAIRAQAEKFGFNSGLTVPLNVTSSIYPKDLDPPQTAISAIGQYDVRVTPMQIAMVAAAIANDGMLMRPNLVGEVRGGDELDLIDKPRPEELNRAVSDKTAAELTDMMIDVVERGTGTNAQIPGVQVAGKTGTAQTGENQPPDAWFMSFAPANDPQVAVAVVVEDGGELGDAASGGRIAAPIAKKVMEAVLRS